MHALQVVVREFLQGLNSTADKNNPLEYLKSIQKMKGEWYNQQGESVIHTANDQTLALHETALIDSSV